MNLWNFTAALTIIILTFGWDSDGGSDILSDPQLTTMRLEINEARQPFYGLLTLTVAPAEFFPLKNTIGVDSCWKKKIVKETSETLQASMGTKRKEQNWFVWGELIWLKQLVERAITVTCPDSVEKKNEHIIGNTELQTVFSYRADLNWPEMVRFFLV